MLRRVVRIGSCIVCGCCLQLGGCGSEAIGDILATHIKTTAVEIGTFLIESGVDNALDLQ